MARKPRATNAPTPGTRFRAYLRATDDIVAAVKDGTMDRAKALDSQAKLVGVLGAQLTRLFQAQLPPEPALHSSYVHPARHPQDDRGARPAGPAATGGNV